MEILFETPCGRFSAELFNGPAAEKIAGIFPLEAAMDVAERSISFPLPLQTALAAGVARSVVAGDITYSFREKRCYIFTQPSDFGMMPSFMVHIGKLSGSWEIVKMIRPSDPVWISVAVSDTAPCAAKEERIMSQSEIDALINQMKNK